MTLFAKLIEGAALYMVAAIYTIMPVFGISQH